MQTQFPLPLDKLALAVSSAVEVKEQTVKQFGIGEDTSITIYFWKESTLKAICAMSIQLMSKSHEYRFAKVADVVCIMRQSLAADSVTMIAEGYISLDPEATDKQDLAAAFVKMPGVVKECLTFTHVQSDQVIFIVKPYTYTVPRLLTWEDEIFTPGRTVMRGGNGRYPLMFSKVMEEVIPTVIPGDLETYYETIAKGIRKLGFEVSWF